MSTKMDYDVLVVGAGPVGLMLATELQLAGVRVVVVERRTELDTAIKAGSLQLISWGPTREHGCGNAPGADSGPRETGGHRRHLDSHAQARSRTGLDGA